ncbi:hypothetical protein [Rhodovulum bhavnagarense]|nr:hypothetical protein [Rhodovulum bhavnagarense]
MTDIIVPEDISPNGERLIHLAGELCQASRAHDVRRVAELDHALRAHALAMVGAMTWSEEAAEADIRVLGHAIAMLRGIAEDLEKDRQALEAGRARERRLRLVYSRAEAE